MLGNEWSNNAGVHEGDFRMADVVATATTQPFFATLGSASATRIMAMCETLVCPRNTVIFEAGNPADNLYLVIEGKVKLLSLIHI